MKALKTGPKIDHQNKVIGGVCAGLAKHFEIDVFWVRAAAILLILSSFGTGIIIYGLLWLFMDD